MPRPSPARRLVAYAAAVLFSLGILGAARHRTARAAERAARVTRVVEALPALVRRALAEPDTRWVEAESAPVKVYAMAGTLAGARAAQLRAEAEAARASNLALLGERGFAPKLHLVYVPDRARMRPITGATPGGTADPADAAAAFVTNADVRAPVRHETMHILAQRTWGDPEGAWVREGIATYAAGRCAGRDLHAIAAALAAEGRLVPLAELPRRFDVRGETGATMYIQSGSVVKYVAETYGTPRLREFYRTGLEGTPASLGVTVPVLERGWRARVARSSGGRERWRAIYADISAHGCE